MLGEQALVRERLVVVARRVEHHLDHAFDMPVCGFKGAGVHAEAPGDRGADLRGIELPETTVTRPSGFR